MLRFVVLGAAGLAAVTVVVLAVLILGSAVLDRPSETMESEVTVDAPVDVVWQVVTDLEGYERWNPLVTRAAGDLRVGGELDLRLELPDGETDEITPEVVILRPDRKLRWQSHRVLPGVADREYEVILEPLDGGRVLVFQQMRIEGILAPLTDSGEEQAALDAMASALVEQVEQTTRRAAREGVR
jgi:hypothetical protein